MPHAGCPHDCCFCNQKIISGSTKLPREGEIAAKIESFRSEAQRYDEVEIAFFGGSFTAIEPASQEHYLKAAAPFLKKNGGFVDVIRISTRPDAIDQITAERLKKYSVGIVELGAQSMDDKVLALSERGHTAEDTRAASKLLKENGFVLGLQTMTGLPGATEESDLNTAREIAAQKPDFVRIYPTIVVKNTKLCRDYEAGAYIPMSTEAAVRLCSKLCEIYAKNGISVARIGLQSTGSISREGAGSEVVGGPYHEAFGQLVRSYDALSAMKDALCAASVNPGSPVKSLTVITNPIYFSDVLGQSRCNAESLKKEFGLLHINVLPPETEPEEIFRKRAGRVTEEKTASVDVSKYDYRLAKVSGAALYTLKQPTGKETSRELREIILRLEFKSMR